jgi:two-component system response regulator DesR
MRKTRVIYVENDPALRGIMSSQLKSHPDIEFVQSFASSHEALAYIDYKNIDVALLDLALGPDSLNGTELGMLLRERNQHIGIVIYSQHVMPDYLHNLSEAVRWGWSYIEKRGDVDIDSLVEILVSTSKGTSTSDITIREARNAQLDNPIAQLTLRQRQIMSLAANGLDANSIARELSLAAITIRQELSRAYAVLIPNPEEGTDLRTSAVLRYLREIRRDETLI